MSRLESQWLIKQLAMLRQAALQQQAPHGCSSGPSLAEVLKSVCCHWSAPTACLPPQLSCPSSPTACCPAAAGASVGGLCVGGA